MENKELKNGFDLDPKLEAPDGIKPYGGGDETIFPFLGVGGEFFSWAVLEFWFSYFCFPPD